MIMIELSIITWALLIFGWIFILLLALIAQILVASRPDNQKTKNLVIGKGEDYRDKTHRRMTFGIAWADLIIWFPLLVIGSIGVILGQVWGYALWLASGAISVYINIILLFSEKQYVYESAGPLAYYTIYWGFFVYWGSAVIIYSILRLAGINI
jgi:hypothetical protein